MIRYRALLIAAGYPDGNDCEALKSDPAFKMAIGRLPESGAYLCSQPTISRLENLPGPTALKRMMAAMVAVFCDSFDAVPRRILLDIDDTEDRVQGGQQLALFQCLLRQPLLPASISMKRPPASLWLSSCAPARRRTGPRWRWSCAMSSAISVFAG